MILLVCSHPFCPIPFIFTNIHLYYRIGMGDLETVADQRKKMEAWLQEMHDDGQAVPAAAATSVSGVTSAEETVVMSTEHPE